MDFRAKAIEYLRNVIPIAAVAQVDDSALDALVRLLHEARNDGLPTPSTEATLTPCESRLGRLVEADRKLIQELQAKVIELERAKFNEPRVRELVAEMMRGVKDDLREMDVDVADAEERFDAAIRSFRAFRAWLTKPKRKPAAVSHPKGWGKPVGKGRRRASKPKCRKAKR